MLCQCTAFAMRFVLSLSDCSTISATRFIESPMDTVSIAIPETFMDSESLLLTPFQSSMIAFRRSHSRSTATTAPSFAIPDLLLHIPPILPTHIVQRMADLPQRVGLHRFHQR